MNKGILLTIGILFCYASTLLSQETNFTVRATVLNHEGEKLAGNLLLLSTIDSSLLKGTYFLEDDVEVTGINQKDFLVKITSLGYLDTTFAVVNESPTQVLDLGVIKLQLSSDSLNTVVVRANIPLFEPSNDGSVKVNVQKTMLASSGNILEVLAKSPNVQVGENSVSVIGKGEALIYLDGKQIPFERLGAIQVGRVDKIEIITNPSAKYDAQGRAVINIITLPNYSEGLQGTLIQNFTAAKHFLYGGTIILDYRKNKLSLSADYGVILGTDWNQSNTERTIAATEGLYTSKTFHEENTKFSYLSNTRFGIDYKLNNKSNVSAEYSGLYDIYDLDVLNQNSLENPGGSMGYIEALNNGETTNRNDAFNLNYNLATDTLGSSLFIGGQYSSFQTTLFDLIDESIYNEEVLLSRALRNNVGNSNISILTAQTDYSKIFGNSSSLDLGVKYSSANHHGIVDLYSRQEGTEEFVLLPGYSNDFEYAEQVSAAYLQFNGSLKGKMFYSVGGRSEYTIAQGTSNILDQKVIDSTYLNIFPNLSISGNLSENWNLAFSYSSRIARPQYQSLDPYVWYQDSLTSVQGNPFLIPELIQSFEGIITYKSYSLKLGYNYSKNPIRYVSLLGETGPNSIILKQINIQQKNGYFATLALPFEAKFWSSYNAISLTYDQYVDNRPEFVFDGLIPQLYIYSYHKFNVKDLFNIELFGEFEGERNDGIFGRHATGSLSIGLSKSFFSGTVNCRFLANDVLQTYRDTKFYTIGQTTVNFTQRLNTNYYRLSVIVYFGKLRDVIYKNKSTSENEQNRLNF